ncbi:sister chromatid cohesion protein Dcc1 [Cokeromyces recurvatus]|uniref:sister chromatid cohesion protein Dcc1 n=1 Tax=Cokeromyces recurvatus TaxID=90255 RepID=UPI00221F2BBF|nr:sister chromatid cohesion protein Dcc1 [Cokeromyces recurvatus]KAI7898758.1 sister chromatid cohesion protein Dcc1 [Cokeromyces recurvatus]
MSKEIIYKNKFEKNTYSLIELGSKELQEAFESGKEVIIKGYADDEAVLCTESKTFLIRQVNTSNSMLLVNENHTLNQYTICDDISNTIELKPCLARLNRIDDLLGESLYSGSKNEKELSKNKTLYSYHDLLSIVQASENELLEALEKKGAFQHEGHFRLFERNYLFRLFDSLMTNAILHGYDFGKMKLREAKKCIKEEMNAVDEEEELPDHILTACINSFINDMIDQDDEFIQFDERKICRFLGEWLLNNPRVKKKKIATDLYD